MTRLSPTDIAVLEHVRSNDPKYVSSMTAQDVRARRMTLRNAGYIKFGDEASLTPKGTQALHSNDRVGSAPRSGDRLNAPPPDPNPRPLKTPPYDIPDDDIRFRRAALEGE